MMSYLRVRAAQHSRIPLLLSVGVRPFSTAEHMARITFSDVILPMVPSSGAAITLAELAAQIEWNMWYEPSCGPLGVFLDRASGGAVTVLDGTVTRSGHSPPPDLRDHVRGQSVVSVNDEDDKFRILDLHFESVVTVTRSGHSPPASAPHAPGRMDAIQRVEALRKELREKMRSDQAQKTARNKKLIAKAANYKALVKKFKKTDSLNSRLKSKERKLVEKKVFFNPITAQNSDDYHFGLE